MEPFQDPMELDHYKRKLGFSHMAVNMLGKIWVFWREEWIESIALDSIQQITMKLELWEELENIGEGGLVPWIIGGDFNVILNEEEKLGGLSFTQNEAMDFALFINNCGLSEIKFVGSKYTWWNGRIEEDCIFKRLDRVSHHQFKEIVSQNWNVDFVGSPFAIFQAKLKKVKKALTVWSKEIFGNIFHQIATIKDVIQV
ncbi:hypothetical protein R3W88_011994 [Solanum pinnatisectum]|uniref:Uncharacterized protein n=1 Tax=Solanum pinnatisectum TaxID=50273 RepID=A0AAV9L7P1_9SOLN|nr:hypothetical protein R3W88_011994 [Solanum pinnatisectum]